MCEPSGTDVQGSGFAPVTAWPPFMLWGSVRLPAWVPPAVDCAAPVAFPSFMTSGRVAVPLMNLQDPRPRAGLEGLL